MNKKLSIYLDLLRVSAALAVVLEHLRRLVTADVPRWLGANGSEAVALFFVLSGFVICFVADVKENDWRSYSVARLARIYSVAILSLAVTFAADKAGAYINPEKYAALGMYQPETIITFLRAITFTTELGTQHVVFGTDEPFWSLGFECAYYLIFGLLIYVRKPFNAIFGAVALVLTAPKIALYFPLWLVGVAAYKLRPRFSRFLSQGAAILIFLSAPVLYAVLHHYLAFRSSAIFDWNVGLEVKAWSFVYFNALGLVFAANLIAFDRAFEKFPTWPAIIPRSIRWLAGVTFTMYLTHLPLLLLFDAVFPPETHARTLIVLGLTLATILVLGEFGERRKALFAAIFRRLLGRRADGCARIPTN